MISLPKDENSSPAECSHGPGYLMRLHVLGAFALFSLDDRNVTPRGRKVQALLALLALAPRGQRTRVWLRDKLWSESNEKNSALSLRQTVFELRKSLGDWADHVLTVDRNAIALCLDKMWVDVRAIRENPALFWELQLTVDTDLLEGCDIVDEEFEDWLMMERQIWRETAEKIQSSPAPEPVAQTVLSKPANHLPQPGLEVEPIYSLGFLPSIQHGCDAHAMHLADYILEGVARNLKEFQPLRILDFRNAESQNRATPGSGETDFFIRVRTLQIHKSITVTLLLFRASHMSMEWGQSIQMNVDELLEDSFPVLSGFIAQNVDRLAKYVFDERRRPQDPKLAGLSAGYTALNLMFKLDETALTNATGLLETAYQDSPNSIYPALQSYASSFILGENLGELGRDAAASTRDIVKSTLEDNPFNSISLACLGHVMGFVFRDHEAAGELLTRALNLNESQAFVWDHYALHKLYSGDFETAYDAAKRAVYLGAYSPISYSYDTTLMMAATMIGRHGEAIVAGQRALGKQPRFSAAMRYLIVNYGHTGRLTEAREVMARMLSQDHDFLDVQVQKERFRLVDRGAEKLVLEGISRAID